MVKAFSAASGSMPSATRTRTLASISNSAAPAPSAPPSSITSEGDEAAFRSAGGRWAGRPSVSVKKSAGGAGEAALEEEAEEAIEGVEAEIGMDDPSGVDRG